mmetsp:Transcript_15193/g.44427  ORF Transcript_15193/g.44427 Transcript_15193/m.44427 type:complete len:242 (-) Transcript_15193:845-1570(-)
MSSCVWTSLIMCFTTLPCMCACFACSPLTIGLRTLLWNSRMSRAIQLCCRYIGGGDPMGTLRSFRKNSVLPPNTRRKMQITSSVALRSISFVPTPPSSFTQSSNESVSTRAMPPRRPACHIMNMCFQDSLSCFSTGRWAPVWLLMQFDSTASGKVARARPTRMKSMTQAPNSAPFREENTTAKPTKRKTAMSAIDAICFSRKDARREPSIVRCVLAKELIIMPQKSTDMMPDMWHTCSDRW